MRRPEWRNRQTRATQNRVPLRRVGSTPTSGIQEALQRKQGLGFYTPLPT